MFSTESALALPVTARPPAAWQVAAWPEVPARRGELAAQDARLAGLLARFEPIQLAEMNRVALLDCTETKYVLSLETLLHALGRLGDAYAVLTVEGQRLNRYRTLYFDTAGFALYHRHQQGARERYKLRAREYVETRFSFLEIKHKTNKQRTVKSRIGTPRLMTSLDECPPAFLAEHFPYDAAEMQPRLWNRYSRVTLASKARPERVTLDVGLTFAWGGQQIALPGVVIAEVKQDRSSRDSEFVSLMRAHGVRSTGFSKYCLGVSLLYPAVKHNRLKAKQRLIAKVMQGEHYDYQ